MAAHFAKREGKTRFVANILKADAFGKAKLAVFVAMDNDLTPAPSGLSKLEREMVARRRRLLQHAEPDRVRSRHAAKQRLSPASKVNACSKYAIRFLYLPFSTRRSRT
jgi:hypothetical protein